MAFAALCAASLASALAPVGWPFELFAHFRPQLFAAAAVLVPLLLAVRRLKTAVTAGIVAALLVPAGAHRVVAAETAPVCAGEDVVVVTANLRYTNHDAQPLLRWLAEERPDVVVLQEITPQWAAVLRQLRDYPQGRILPRRDPYGIALLSRWPIEAIEPVDLAGDGLPSLDATVRVRGRTVRVIGLHTRWPITPHLARLRDRALERAAVLVRARPVPTVAAGDLNLTPDAPMFAVTLEKSGLRDAFGGRGWHPTWMAGFWPLALRIDHQLASPDMCVERVRVGPDIGSDHRPLIASYRLPAVAGPKG